MIRHLIVPFDKHEYDFHGSVLKILDAPLALLHRDRDYPVFSREQDQSSHWHEKFYANNDQFLILYERFITNWVSNIIHEPFVYQTIPTFRVQLPGNVAIGGPHKDTQYGHSPHTINFWVPLTSTNMFNSIHIGTFIPEMREGEVLIFDGANLTHWNIINEGVLTRVSFDFRVIPQRFFSPGGKSINNQKEFKVGSYYKESK